MEKDNNLKVVEDNNEPFDLNKEIEQAPDLKTLLKNVAPKLGDMVGQAFDEMEKNGQEVTLYGLLKTVMGNNSSLKSIGNVPTKNMELNPKNNDDKSRD